MKNLKKPLDHKTELEIVQINPNAFCVLDKNMLLLLATPGKNMLAATLSLLEANPLLENSKGKVHFGITTPCEPSIFLTENRKAQQKMLGKCIEKIQQAGYLPFALLPENNLVKAKDETVIAGFPDFYKNVQYRWTDNSIEVSKSKNSEHGMVVNKVFLPCNNGNFYLPKQEEVAS